jgi:hypothetical protein
MQLIQFKANEIEKIWPLVKDHVQSALDRNQNFRDHTDVKENCINGFEQLWVIVDKKDNVYGVCVTQIVEQKNYKIEIYGRPGWSKMLKPLGYDFTHVQMDKFIGGLH